MELITGSAALARRLEDADARNAALAAEAQQRIRPFEGESGFAIAGGFAAFAGAGSPFTHAVGIGMSGPVSAADIDRIEEFYFSRECNVNLDLCPFADPTLPDLLGRRGYRVVEFNNILVRRLTTPSEPADPRIEQVNGETVADWSRMLAEGFFEHEPSIDELEIGRAVFGMRGAAAFCLNIDGNAASGGAACIHSGLAVLFGDATLPRFRGRGLQTALISRRLSWAIANVADLATAATLPGTVSQRNYERSGFRVAYAKVNMQRDWPT